MSKNCFLLLIILLICVCFVSCKPRDNEIENTYQEQKTKLYSYEVILFEKENADEINDSILYCLDYTDTTGIPPEFFDYMGGIELKETIDTINSEEDIQTVCQMNYLKHLMNCLWLNFP